MNSGLTSHQQRGHTETGPRFKVSSERPEKRGIDLATPGLVVQRVIHYTTAAPANGTIYNIRYLEQTDKKCSHLDEKQFLTIFLNKSTVCGCQRSAVAAFRNFLIEKGE